MVYLMIDYKFFWTMRPYTRAMGRVMDVVAGGISSSISLGYYAYLRYRDRSF